MEVIIIIKDERSLLAKNLGEMARRLLGGKVKDVNYPGRSNGHNHRASDIVGNDLLSQKAVRKHYGFKK